ncbi:MAG: aminopeptidase [Myxococcaceae bacterium]
MRATVPLLALWLALPLKAGASELPSPEVQACLTSLREGERTRAEATLGPLAALPFLEADLQVRPEDRSVTGSVSYSWTPKAPSQSLELRLTPNAFGNSPVRLHQPLVNGEPATLATVTDDVVRVEFPKSLPAGERVRVELQLVARVPRGEPESSVLSALSANAAGGAADHGAFSAQPGVLSLVGILPRPPVTLPDGTRGAGPTGIGDLALYDAANVLLSVSVPRGWQAVAAGAALGETADGKGGTRFRFGIAATRDVALLVTRGYRSARREVSDVTVESFFPEELARPAERLLDEAATLLEAMEHRLGPTPYRTLRVVAAPLSGGAGGMEFPGLVTVSTPLVQLAEHPGRTLGIPEADLPPGATEMVGALLDFALAHELAHQWFPGLVGSDPIAAPVADEALAQAVALLAVEWTQGAEAARAVDAQQVSGGYRMWRALGGQDAAADRPTSAFPDEMTYAALVYGKAPGLHARQRALLGDAAFVRDLRAYVDAHRWGWADSSSLTALLAQRHPGQAEALRALQRRWWSEAHGDEDLGGAEAAAGLPSEAEVEKLMRQIEQ